MRDSALIDAPSPIPAISIEAAADRIICRWGESFQKHYNPIDEEMILRVYAEDQMVAEYRVEHLSQKEIHLRPGSYRLEIARYFRPEVELRSPLYTTPQVSWNGDSPSSHLVVWSGIDWEAVRHEVEQVHHLEWDTSASVALRVLWNRAGELVNEWIPVPFKDHLALDGKVEEVELAVLGADSLAAPTPQAPRVLKSLFLARQSPRKPLQVLANQTFSVASPVAQLRLYREIIETDTLQVRAVWSAFPSGEQLEIVLRRGDEELEKQGPVGPDGDWLFNHLQDGTYTVELRSAGGGKKKKAAVSQVSDSVTLPKRESKARLMPVTERRAFAYWHVAADAWAPLVEEFGDLLGRVRCYIQVGIRAEDGKNTTMQTQQLMA